MAKEEPLEFTGTVTEILPNAMFRVKLDNDHEILAHTAGKMRKHRIRVLAGDRVNVTTTFSENVNKTGSPQQTMVIGSTNRTAAYYSLSGSSMVYLNTIELPLSE